MCMYISFATLRWRAKGSSSRSDARIAADSFAINARSSALVLHWRTERISSLRFRHADGQVRASGARDKGQRRGRVSSESFSASSGWVEISNALSCPKFSTGTGEQRAGGGS